MAKILLYEELVKLHNNMVYVCKTRYSVRDLNCLQAKSLRLGRGSFTLPGSWLYEPGEGNRKGASQFLAWQEELSLLNTPLETINAHALVGIKDSNYWEI